MRFIQTLIFIIFALHVFSADSGYKLTLHIQNFSQTEIYLADFYGDRNTYVDTAFVDEKGNAVFEMKKELQPGLFRVLLNQNLFFDLVYNHEDIAIATDARDLYESLVVEKSEENKIYYSFLRKMNDYNRKFDLLAPINDYYPRNDTFFILGRQEFVLIQAELISWIQETVESNPDRWVSKIIRQRKPLFFDPSLTDIGRREYAIEHFFDLVDFTDIDLLRSNVYTSMSIEYLSLYGNPNFTQEQLQKEFIKAVDKIMLEAMDNAFVYQFIVEYLVGGFEKYHFDLVLDYIAENYAPEQCEDENAISDLETRLKKYALLSVGKTAPQIDILDAAGKPVSLHQIKSDYTLLIFWSSNCPHCLETLPEIDALYNGSLASKDITLFTVSLDTDQAAWEKALAGRYAGWVNTCSFEGWNTRAAVDYNVYATPTMFLLNAEKVIVAKPITLHELKQALMDVNLLQ